MLCKYPQTFEKFEFILKKYLLLLKHLILRIPVNPGISKIKLGGENIYYESEYGVANYQAMLVNFQKNYFKYVKHLKKPTVIDVGAHVGLFSQTMAKLFDKPTIYACEPVSLAFTILKKNTQRTRSIKPVQVGFYDKKVRSKIFYIEHQLLVSTLFPERFDWGEKPLAEMVQMETLDSFIEREKITRIDILKLDTEGAEEKILKGAHKTLAKIRYLILEISLYKSGGSTFSSVIRHLYSKDYNFQLINIQTPFFKTAGRIATVDLLFENLKLSK